MPLSPVVGASLISGGASLLGNAFTNFMNSQSVDEQYRRNFDMMRYQNDFNVQQQNKMLEYNLPINQRKRFEAAGINPYMALSSMNPGSIQSSLQSASANPTSAKQFSEPPISEAFNNYLSSQLQAAQIRNLNATAESQEISNKTQARRQGIEIRVLEENLHGLVNTNKINDDTRELQEQMISLGVDNARANLAIQQVQEKILNFDLGIKKEYEAAQIKVAIYSSFVQNYATIANVAINQQNANTNSYNARTNRINVNNNYKLGLQANQIARYNAITNRMDVNNRNILGWQQIYLQRRQMHAVLKNMDASTLKILSENKGIKIDNKWKDAIHAANVSLMNNMMNFNDEKLFYENRDQFLNSVIPWY